MRFPADPGKLDGARLSEQLREAGFERAVITYFPHEEQVDIQARRSGGSPVSEEDRSAIEAVVADHLGVEQAELREQADEPPEPTDVEDAEEPEGLFFEGVNLPDPDPLVEALSEDGYEDIDLTQVADGLYVFARTDSGNVVDGRSRKSVSKLIDEVES